MKTSPVTDDLPDAFMQKNARYMELDYLDLEKPTILWMEIQVFYVRVRCPGLENAPESLTIRSPARVSGSGLEINRVRVSSDQEVALVLRRDRMDTQSSEVIYVCTDMIKTCESLPFKICDQDGTLVYANIKRSDSFGHGNGPLCKTSWSMEYKCAVSASGCAFMKGKADSSGNPAASPLMEIFVAGRYANAPVILTQTVPLVARRRQPRRITLDAIPESEECDKPWKDCSTLDSLSSQMEEHMFYRELDGGSTRSLGMYDPDSYPEDGGELTWFNTGVRVGVGIGLGMCVGIGIGVGLLMRGYQATTKALKRKLI